jgi:lysophospholipase L1-like esterase
MAALLRRLWIFMGGYRRIWANNHLNPACDSGDYLHPSAAGYQTMEELVPLAPSAR